MRTRFTAAYGVEHPIVSAGMAFVARAPLAAAVSAAGGMGTLGGTAMPPDLLGAEIDAIRAATDRPFAVNLIPRFAEAAHIDVLVGRRVPAVTFFWDDPAPEWAAALKDAGIPVWIQIGSLDEAAAAVAAGADGLVVQGVEAGGHNRSTASTMTLVPAVVDEIAPSLLIASGGIADGRGVAAVLALGADAAMLGTRFLASAESAAHPDYRARVVEAAVHDTVRHNIFGFEFPDATARGLRNPIVAEWEGRDDPPPYRDLDPAEQPTVGTADMFGQPMPLQRFFGFLPTTGGSGDLDQMSLLAGETAGLIGAVQPAGAIVTEIAASAQSVARALAGD